jgi:Na+-transporting NADH:ubiquinone oxidoreductase subunit F
MSTSETTVDRMGSLPVRDYSLNRKSSERAVELGLAEADWYQCAVPRAEMRKLLVRRDGPAIRDTLIWFGLIFGFASLTVALWGSWWAVLPYLVYAALYASTSDSRWHESSHGTAFKTDWMNDALYEVASFMVMRESTVWRWSHNRHHSDTIILGRDPEIAVPRPPDIKGLFLGAFNIKGYPKYFRRIFMHSFGNMAEDELEFIPASEHAGVFRRARIYVLIYLGVIGLAIATGSILPLLFVGLPQLFGTWLMLIYGLTQHTGMAENVLDHRLNSRTFHSNIINRFLYWNMNYHVEHHMFPLVPYHAVPRLHELIKDDCPEPYPSLWSCWKEIPKTLLKQVKDPAYHVKRILPAPPEGEREKPHTTSAAPDAEGWVEAFAAADLGAEDVLRFDRGNRTFAIYRDASNQLFASDGVCTHGNTHLAGGLVKGGMIECPKHNGRFNLADGSPARTPICRGLATYPVEERGGRIWLNVERAGGSGARSQKSYPLRVTSSRSVATFIREITLETIGEEIDFTPGDYLQFAIPVFEGIAFRDFEIPEPYAAVWENHHLFDLVAENTEKGRRNNYSLANNPAQDGVIKLNVRIATPPGGQDCPPGVGSSYLFSLKPGDTIEAIGPFGDFHIKPTQKEMIYIGGGAGMGPLRAHLSHLLENDGSARKMSFWYGARSRQEIYHADIFDRLEREHGNFSFHLALSSPLPEDAWEGETGFIHEVVAAKYLDEHPSPGSLEFYLCGPPMMIEACKQMLDGLGVARGQIAYDEF